MAKLPLDQEPEPAPLFGKWRNAYIAVVVVFILQVAIFYIFSLYFS